MSLLPQVNAYHTDGKGQYDYFFAMANQSAKEWSLFPAISSINAANNNIISTNTITLSSQVVTATPTDILLNGVPIVTSTVNNWALAPAVGNVNFHNFEILSTTSIQLDDVYLSANANELLINGIPIVTSTAFSMMSSITDWAYFQALSSINMGDSNTIQNCAGIELNNSVVTTGTGNTIRVNGQNPVAVWNTYTATGNVNMGNNNIVAIDTLSAVTGSFTSNVSQSVVTNTARINNSLISLKTNYLADANISSLYASTITTRALYATSTITSNVIFSNATNSNVLTTTGASLFYNGALINTGGSGNVALWSQFPGVSLIRNNRGYANGALEIIGQSYFNGDVQMRITTGGTPAVEFDRSSVNGPFLKVNAGQFRATGTSNLLGNSNTYATQTYIAGGCTIDGGNSHGCSIGCLPGITGINTVRIDVLPIGMLLTSPTTIGILATTFSFNVTASANLAAGAAIAIAAGSYITLEHGFGIGSNGIYVQVAGRNDTARLLLEFGGSVGPSIDNPGTAAKVDYHGQNLFIQNITNSFAGNRWPLQRDIYIDSVSTLDFVNGAGLTVLPNSTLSITGSFDTINTHNISTVNLYVESVFARESPGNINFYDNITATKNIACYSNITAPYMATSTIYGTSGATIDGALWLQSPSVTATGNLRVTNTLYSDDARFTGQTTLSTILAFVGEAVTFDNSQTNIPNNALISSLTVSTINGIQMPNMPIQFNELTVPRNVFSVSGSLLSEQTITITNASRIWAIASVEYNNTGSGGANNYFIDTYITLSLPLVTYNSTRATIPDRFTPTVPSSTNVTVQQVTAVQLPGTYTLRVYAAASATNTHMTCTHCDFTVSAGYF